MSGCTLYKQPTNIALSFQPVEETEPIIIDKDMIAIEQELTFQKYIFYVYHKDTDNYYIGVQLAGQIHEIGEIAYQLDMIAIDSINVEGNEYIRIFGALGAIYPIEYYVTLEDDNLRVHIDKALPIQIADIDNDHVLEWISQYDGQVTVYKPRDNEWFKAQLNDVFDGYIFFDAEENCFNIVYDQGAKSQRIDRYQMKKDTLIPN